MATDSRNSTIRLVAGCLDQHSSVLVAIGFFVIVAAFAPIGTMVEFGGDEGYELMKAYLWSQGVSLYDPVWNDQPPLHSVLVGVIFKIVGVSVFWARLLTITFAALLLGCLHELVKGRLGSVAAFASISALVVSNEFITWSVSAMLGLPSMSVAYVSFLLLTKSEGSNSRQTLILSGLLMGFAMQIKLTAALMAPAILFDRSIFRLSISSLNGWAKCRLFAVDAALWSVSCLVGFAIIWALFPSEDFSSFWSSHFSEEIRGSYRDHDSIEAMHNMLMTDQWLVLSSVLAIFWVFKLRTRALGTPVVLLLGVYLVHAIQRPFWNYYYLHLSIPMAWLHGAMVGLFVQRLTFHVKSELSKAAWGKAVDAVTCSFVVATTAVGISDGARSIHSDFRRAKPIDAQPQIRRLKELSESGTWIYADRPIYAFHARLPIIPELAIIPAKRIRSGKIDSRRFLDYLRRDMPAIICLSRQRLISPEFEVFLQHYYDPDVHSIYVLKRQNGPD